MAQKDDAQVLCPFYMVSNKRNNMYYISCEPYTDSAAAVQTVFTREALRRHKTAFCRCEAWNSCPYASLMLRLYEEL